jgi:hypothetical protein
MGRSLWFGQPPTIIARKGWTELTLPPEAEETQSQRDARALERFGCAQELLRSMGGFSNFAISFSIIEVNYGRRTNQAATEALQPLH